MRSEVDCYLSMAQVILARHLLNFEFMVSLIITVSWGKSLRFELHSLVSISLVQTNFI